MTDYVQAIQRFVDEVEERLEDATDVDSIIALTFVSKYHFYRLFKAVTGISVLEYVRRRRLIQASAALLKSDESVLDIAVRYGFGSQEVFTRNFKKLFLVPPAKYRLGQGRSAAGEDRPPNEIASRIDAESIWLDIKARHGQVTVTDQFVRIDGLRLVGVERRSCDDNIHTIFPFILTFVQQAEQIANRVSDTLYRLCYDVYYVGETAHFTEMIPVDVEGNAAVPVPDGIWEEDKKKQRTTIIYQ